MSSSEPLPFRAIDTPAGGYHIDRLRNQERAISLLVKSIKDYGIFMLDPGGIVVTWNEGAERINGYNEAEILGKHFSLFYTPDAVAANHPQNELLIALRDGRYEEEGWRVRKDGTQFWANVVISPVEESGVLIGFAKVTRDLTERHRAALQRDHAARSQQLFELMVKSVKDYAIFMLDPNGNVLTWNEGAQALKGYTAAEIVGKHFSNFYPKEVRERRHPEYELEVATREGRYEEEGWRIRKDGTQFWANVVITAIFNDGKLVGFGKVTRDLTERKLSEEQKEKHAKMIEQTNDELQHLAYVVSHELQAPISTISRYGNLISVRYKDKLGPDAKEFFEKTEYSAKLIARMVDDLWNYARIARPNLDISLVPMNAVAQQVREDLAADLADNELIVHELPELNANRKQITFCLRELVRNAVRYRSARPPLVEIDARPDGHGWLFSVKDNGVGIDSVYNNDAFKLFHRLNAGPEPEATGMGLAMCRKIVEQHDGRMWLDSKIGQGTTVYFWLPAIK